MVTEIVKAPGIGLTSEMMTTIIISIDFQQKREEDKSYEKKKTSKMIPHPAVQAT